MELEGFETKRAKKPLVCGQARHHHYLFNLLGIKNLMKTVLLLLLLLPLLLSSSFETQWAEN